MWVQWVTWFQFLTVSAFLPWLPRVSSWLVEGAWTIKHGSIRELTVAEPRSRQQTRSMWQWRMAGWRSGASSSVWGPVHCGTLSQQPSSSCSQLTDSKLHTNNSERQQCKLPATVHMPWWDKTSKQRSHTRPDVLQEALPGPRRTSHQRTKKVTWTLCFQPSSLLLRLFCSASISCAEALIRQGSDADPGATCY